MDPREHDASLARAVVAAGEARDREAERALVARFLPRVRAWARNRVRDEAEASDLAQEVSIVLVERLRAGRVEELEHVGTFVLGTCRNVLLAWRRGERRRSAILERNADFFTGGDDPRANIAEWAIDRGRVADCFGKLASRAQSVLALTFFADASGEEIAAELQLTVANVRVLRHRALSQLSECVGT